MCPYNLPPPPYLIWAIPSVSCSYTQLTKRRPHDAFRPFGLFGVESIRLHLNLPTRNSFSQLLESWLLPIALGT